MTRGDSEKAGFSTFDSVTTVPQSMAEDSSGLAVHVVRRLRRSMKFFGGIPVIGTTNDAPKSTGSALKSESQAGPEWLVPPAQIHVDIIYLDAINTVGTQFVKNNLQNSSSDRLLQVTRSEQDPYMVSRRLATGVVGTGSVPVGGWQEMEIPDTIEVNRVGLLRAEFNKSPMEYLKTMSWFSTIGITTKNPGPSFSELAVQHKVGSGLRDIFDIPKCEVIRHVHYPIFECSISQPLFMGHAATVS
ncbi:hypothetical protein PHLCEN_2v11908 [Hermanssonia centrifuga]|uniref:Uncharacterized protein n=1 Tax=Hermanssonia centrifuga TaxID=98765 RepID=A0A2R6NIT4_9APHY|nr:hypothetical protein PHLCEN_2v11908 [Hermanssonia centrifuga]